MLNCPICDVKSLNTKEYILLGPDRSIECSICKAEFSLKKINWIYFIIFFIIIITVDFILPSTLPIYIDLLIFILEITIFSFMKVKFMKLYYIKDIW